MDSLLTVGPRPRPVDFAGSGLTRRQRLGGDQTDRQVVSQIGSVGSAAGSLSGTWSGSRRSSRSLKMCP